MKLRLTGGVDAEITEYINGQLDDGTIEKCAANIDDKQVQKALRELELSAVKRFRPHLVQLCLCGQFPIRRG